VNPVFVAMLLHAPFQAIDTDGRGTIDLDEFLAYFGKWATPEEKLDVFRMIDTEGTGVITYGAFQTFQKDHENGSKPADSKVGCPDFLEYCGLLNGVRLACERDTFMERFRLAGQPLPPTPDWLLRTMEKEWMGAAKLYVHWQYVIAPVPGHQAGRRFPDWNGGFSVRDQGHEGMTVEDFMNTPEALAADLSAPEVVGHRLYTGPGYEPLNRSLRANSGRFTVTQFCIDSAVGKLARCASGSEILLRGLRKPMNPRWVRRYGTYRGISHRRLALSDPGFVSTTTDVEIATGPDFGGPVVFLLYSRPPQLANQRVGFIASGANVQWVSQYPRESEVLLPSNTIFVPRLKCRHLRKQSAVQLPPEKAVYEFHVYFPWDFVLNTPFISHDHLQTANELLRLEHSFDVAFKQDCKAGHRGLLTTEVFDELVAVESRHFPRTRPNTANMSNHEPPIPLSSGGVRREMPVGWYLGYGPGSMSPRSVQGIPVDVSRETSDQLANHTGSPPMRPAGEHPSPVRSRWVSPRSRDYHSLQSEASPIAEPNVDVHSPPVFPTQQSPTANFPEFTTPADGEVATRIFLNEVGGSDAVRLHKLALYTEEDQAKVLAAGSRPVLDDGIDDGAPTPRPLSLGEPAAAVVWRPFPEVAAICHPFATSLWNYSAFAYCLTTIPWHFGLLVIASSATLSAMFLVGVLLLTASAATTGAVVPIVLAANANRNGSPSPSPIYSSQSASPTNSPTPSPNSSQSPAPDPQSPSPPPSSSVTPSPSPTGSQSVSDSPSPSPDPSQSPGYSSSDSPSSHPSDSPSGSSSDSPTISPSPSAIPTLSPVASPSPTPSDSPSPSPSPVLFAWGYSAQAQTTNFSSSVCSPLSVDVSNAAAGYVALAMGYYHSGVLLESGALYVWGTDSNGQLGLGSTDVGVTITTPTLVAFPAGTFLTALAIGGYHTGVIGSTSPTDAVLYMWGRNNRGQLGIGNLTQMDQPTLLQGTQGTSYTALSLGWDHSCAVNGGSLYCWGDNTYCEISDPSNSTSFQPSQYQVTLASYATVLAVSLGEWFTMVLLTDGTVWMWGYNTQGQLGQGVADSGTHCVPTQPTTLPAPAIQVTAGLWHVCAILQGNDLWCWGLNVNGELGDGTFTDRYVPTQAINLTSVTDVSCGDYQTYAVVSGNTLYGFGKDQYCQLLDVTQSQGDQSFAVPLPGLPSSVSIVAKGSSARSIMAVF